MLKRHQDIKEAYYYLNQLSHNQSLNKDHHVQILGLKKFYYHNLKGLDKQAKKIDLQDSERYND